MTPEQRVSDEHLAKAILGQSEYFASFRVGVDCIGGAQAKAGYDALLDLRDCRAALRAAEKERDEQQKRGDAWADRVLGADEQGMEWKDRAQAAESLLAEAERVLAGFSGHHECEDCWYSCPKAENYCNDAGDTTRCECGADEAQALLAKLKAHRETMGAGENDAASGSGGAIEPTSKHAQQPNRAGVQAATPALTVTRDELRALAEAVVEPAITAAREAIAASDGRDWIRVCPQEVADRVLSRWLAERGAK